MREVLSGGLSPRKVKVQRLKLLETLKQNLDTHRKEYQESLLAYQSLAKERLHKLQRKAQQALADNFAAIERKIDRFDPESEDHDLSDTVVLLNTLSFNLKVPQDHSRSYEVAIQMAEWEVEETIELTQDQFQAFVLDDWEWQQEFKFLNRSYTEAVAAHR